MNIFEGKLNKVSVKHGKKILMKDVQKIVRFLQCFSCGKCRFNTLKRVTLSAIANMALNFYFLCNLSGK